MDHHRAAEIEPPLDCVAVGFQELGHDLREEELLGEVLRADDDAGAPVVRQDREDRAEDEDHREDQGETPDQRAAGAAAKQAASQYFPSFSVSTSLRGTTQEATSSDFVVGQAEVAEAAGPARLAVESTGGSVENLVRLGMGDLDLAIARSDLQAHAWQATGPFDYAPPFDDLRSILALHGEPLISPLSMGLCRRC